MIKQTGGKSVGKSAGGRRIGTPEGITGPVGVHASERVWREMERDGKVGSDLKVVVLDQVSFSFAFFFFFFSRKKNRD